jgi:hypothetical protein
VKLRVALGLDVGLELTLGVGLAVTEFPAVALGLDVGVAVKVADGVTLGLAESV